ncbi:TPA: hypothetical protein DCX16_02650 [bacterium]|nr:hypothetical protein [bacterium]
MKVKEIMSRDITTIKPDRPLLELVKFFGQPTIGGLPVVEDSGNIVGIVTMMGIIGHFLPHSPLLLQEFISCKDESAEVNILSVDWENTKAEDIMEKRITIISEEESIIRAAALFYELKVRMLPVVNQARELIGVVTLSDICNGIHKMISNMLCSED